MTTVGLDIETQDDQIWCLGAANGDKRTATQNWRALLNSVEGETPVFHNAKFDLSYLDHVGDRFGTEFRDTIIEAHMLGFHPLNLSDLTSVFLTGSPLDKTVVKERKQKRYEERADTVLDVCSKDAWASWALDKLWEPALKKYEPLLEKERKVTRVLMDMERTGLPLDQKKVKQAIRLVMQKMGAAEQRLAAQGIKEPGNKEAIAQRFWRHKKKIMTTKSGQLSTTAVHLREYAATPEEKQWVEDLIEWRQMDKFRGTYLENWKGQDWLHASLNQTGTMTWRFSCSNPNLQNVTKSKIIPLYQLFVAPEGYTFITADYSQAELRMLANLTQDPAMIKAYLEDGDLHHSTLLGTPWLYDMWNGGDDVAQDKARTNAKIINFGIAYLISAYGLAPKLKAPETVAQQTIDAFYNKYKRVRPWQTNQQEFALEHGYVETFEGRPLWVPGIFADDGQLFHHAEKQCSNYPIQGGVAEIVKDAMLRAPQYAIMQIHDEILYLVPKSEAAEYRRHLEEVLVDRRHTVPYTIETDMGDSWGDIKKIPYNIEDDDDDEE